MIILDNIIFRSLSSQSKSYFYVTFSTLFHPFLSLFHPFSPFWNALQNLFHPFWQMSPKYCQFVRHIKLWFSLCHSDRLWSHKHHWLRFQICMFYQNSILRRWTNLLRSFWRVTGDDVSNHWSKFLDIVDHSEFINRFPRQTRFLQWNI